MSDHLVFLLLGLGNGAVYAALGLALVMTYRSSGVVNFATGAVALYVAYTYAYLRQGQLINPIPGMDSTIDLGTGEMGLYPALLISLVVAGLLGVILYAIVFRPLRTAAPPARAVASIGVMLFFQALLAVRVGTNPVSVAPILPTDVWTVGDARIRADRIWFAVVIVLLALVISLWFRFTRFGLSTRAAAESEKGALVTELSPERIALANWALSTAVAGLAGILIATIGPVIPVSYTLFIVPALAAALVGNFTLVPVAVAAGLAIGMLQSWCTYAQGQYDWFPSAGSGQLVPLIIILGFLLLRGQSLPSRGSIIQQSIGVAPRPKNIVIPGALFAAVAIIGIFITTGSWRNAVITSLIFAIIGISQVIVTGFTGQISLAQFTLAGVGAFSLYRMQHNLNIPFPFSPLLAAVAAAILGVIVGLPALRVRGLPVAVATLALAVAVQGVWFENVDWNGGLQGSRIEDATLFGINLGVGSGTDAPRRQFALMVLVVLLLVALGTALLRTSRLGSSMLAVRANERSAAAAGIDVARVKIMAFGIGGFVAGLGGCMLAYLQTQASPESYDVITGIGLFSTSYLAGVTSLSGGILAGIIGAGGIVYIFFDRVVQAGSYYTVISAILLVFTVIQNPEGIIGPLHENVAWVRKKFGWTGKSRRSSADEATAAGETSPLHVPTEGTLLTVKSAGVRYGGVVAVDDVSFEVQAGEILGLIGPNGAGKTTLIDAISGFANATGSVVLEGEELADLKPHRRIQKGLGRTFQGIELYEDLTVFENVEVGTTAARRDKSQPTPNIYRLFKLMKLDGEADRPVRELSQGQRQLVSVARALAGRPHVVMLDEPAGGLDSTESRWLGERLQNIRDAGMTIVMVDHDMGLVLNVCDRIVVLDLGKVIAIGTPAEIQKNPAVTRAYLGTTHSPVGAES